MDVSAAVNQGARILARAEEPPTEAERTEREANARWITRVYDRAEVIERERPTDAFDAWRQAEDAAEEAKAAQHAAEEAERARIAVIVCTCSVCHEVGSTRPQDAYQLPDKRILRTVCAKCQAVAERIVLDGWATPARVKALKDALKDAPLSQW